MLMFDRISESATRRRIRQGPVPRRARREAGPLVFSCHFKNDPVHAGAAWGSTRCAVVALPRLGRRRGPRPALGLGDLKFSGQVLPHARKVVYQTDIKRRDAWKAGAGRCPTVASMDGETIYRAKDLKVGLSSRQRTQPGN